MTAAVGDEGDSDWYKRLPDPADRHRRRRRRGCLFLACDDAAYITGAERDDGGGRRVSGGPRAPVGPAGAAGTGALRARPDSTAPIAGPTSVTAVSRGARHAVATNRQASPTTIGPTSSTATFVADPPSGPSGTGPSLRWHAPVPDWRVARSRAHRAARRGRRGARARSAALRISGPEGQGCGTGVSAPAQPPCLALAVALAGVSSILLGPARWRVDGALVADRLGVELGAPLAELHERAVGVGEGGPDEVGLVLPDRLVLEHLPVDLVRRTPADALASSPRRPSS